MSRPRRRASRISDSPEYDRTADRPDPSAAPQQPDVDADPETEPEIGQKQRLLEERPPHY